MYLLLSIPEFLVYCWQSSVNGLVGYFLSKSSLWLPHLTFYVSGCLQLDSQLKMGLLWLLKTDIKSCHGINDGTEYMCCCSSENAGVRWCFSAGNAALYPPLKAEHLCLCGYKTGCRLCIFLLCCRKSPQISPLWMCFLAGNALFGVPPNWT